MAGRPFDNELAVRSQEAVGRKDQAAVRPARHGLDRPLDVRDSMNGRGGRLHSERARGALKRADEELGLGGRVGVENESNVRKAGRNLLEQLDPFAADRELEGGKPGDVATRM